MNSFRVVLAASALIACMALLTPGAAKSAAAGREAEDEERHDGGVAQGFAIAPVPLNISHPRDKRWVGLGSYLVNAVGSCNDCHTFPNYTAGHNPFLGQPEQINTSVYLA